MGQNLAAGEGTSARSPLKSSATDQASCGGLGGRTGTKVLLGQIAEGPW